MTPVLLTFKMPGQRLYSVPEMFDLSMNRVCENRKDTEKTLVQDWLNLKPGTVLNKQNLSITVLKPGRLNIHEGPDILDVMLIINGQIKTGAVECHLNSRSWLSHRHHLNPDFDSVILHVVRKNSPMDISLPFPTIELIPGHGITFVCDLDPQFLSHTFLDTIFHLANERWQKQVHSFLKICKGNLKSHCLEKSFAVLGAGGNQKPFLKLAQIIRSKGIGYMDKNMIKSGIESEMRSLKGEWKYLSIRPAQWPEKRLLTAVELIRFIYSDEWIRCINPQEMISVLRKKIRSSAGEGCVTELLGNVFLPLGASQSVITGDTGNQAHWKTAWNSLILPYSYGKYIRQFGNVLTSKHLRLFPVLQGLKVLESHFCRHRFCSVCPLKNTHDRLEQNSGN